MLAEASFVGAQGQRSVSLLKGIGLRIAPPKDLRQLGKMESDFYVQARSEWDEHYGDGAALMFLSLNVAFSRERKLPDSCVALSR